MEVFTQHYILTFIASSLLVGLGGTFAFTSPDRVHAKSNFVWFAKFLVYVVLIGSGVFGQTLSWRGLDHENEKKGLVHSVLAELDYNVKLKKSSNVLMNDSTAFTKVREFLPRFKNLTMYEVLRSDLLSSQVKNDSALLILIKEYVYRSEDLNERIVRTEALYFSQNDTTGLAENRKNMLESDYFMGFLVAHNELVSYLFLHYENYIAKDYTLDDFMI